MILPRGFNSAWAKQQLDEFIALTVPEGGGGGFAWTPRGSREDIFAQSSVVDPILAAVIPDWREVCRGDRLYEFARESEAAIRARTLLDREEEMLDNLGDSDAIFTASRFHPWVWEPSRSLWASGHFRSALQTAGTALDGQLQVLAGRSDVAGVALVRELLSEKPAEPQRPRLAVPVTGSDDNDRSLRQGLRALGEAAFMLVRNLRTHRLDELSEQEALEQMAILSLFARYAEEFGVDPRTSD